MSSEGAGDSSQESESGAVQRWDPARLLRRSDPAEARLSRGFLRCAPAKWFPGFATQWLPLAHSLGVEMRFIEARPQMTLPTGYAEAFRGLVDEEPIAICIDDPSVRVVLEALSPRATKAASAIALEYIARRFLASLSLAWTGPESSVVKFDRPIDPYEVTGHAAVKCVFQLTTGQVVLWLVLGPALVERLDWLWRRQIQSTAQGAGRATEKVTQLSLEVAQLAVPPALLGDYMRPQTVVDLETAITDLVVVRQGQRGIFPARAVNIGGNLGFEVLPGPVPSFTLPEGTTRVAVQLATFQVDGSGLAELGQVGALHDTGIKLSDLVQIVINGEQVAKAHLCTYEGRFAISIG